MTTYENLMAETSELIRKFRNPQWGATQLRRVAILQGLTDNELLELYQLGKIRSLNAKVNAVIEGEPTRGLYILLYGRVSIYKTDKTTGSMHRLTFLEEGSIFGELSLFDNAPRSATVTTESPCHLFYLDAENFLRYLDSKGDAIKTRFYKQCAEDLADRFRNQNSDYIQAQKLLWQYALRKTNPQESDHSKKSRN